MSFARLLKPLPALAGAALAILFGWLLIEDQLAAAVAVAGSALVVVAALYFGGRRTFAARPRSAGLLMEVGLFAGILIAGIAGGVLLWLGVEKELWLKDDAGENAKALSAAAVAALTAYFGDAFITPEQGWGNPVKAAIKRDFGGSFKDRKDALEKDARRAVQEERYGAEAPEHRDHVVDGWGWDARRLRTRHIQDQLDRR